ncbi:hypothetical protein D3C81_538580 [compost metagenome]|uniref:hypothetical protein n=1 Tax=Paenibacillus sp. CGMCC 1.18879 TaxID=2834466 RepID=UPI000F962DEF|nr:hypothetical protein [Paenibacillus sp. CGMCC 1.18879]MBY9078996.1 hypothetical protein [Paenibacillus sp. CGMCC 1.18879]
MRKNLIAICVLILALLSSGSVSNDSGTSISRPYYGVWQIVKVFTYGPVSAYDQKDIDQLLGQKVTYSDKVAGIANREVSNPYYKESDFTDGDFVLYFNLTLAGIGVKETSIRTIEVFSDIDCKNNYTETGSIFFLTNSNDRLIMYDQGVFFEMKKDQSK